ncbi:MAG: hypothetical protein ACREH4_03055 [Vitreimonas sp.]
MSARASLTGSWSGAYRYPGAGRETVFNAQIEESIGAFIGSVQEPNDFASGGAVLHASIEGSREGASVTFTKFYDHADIRHSIRYEGAVDGTLMRIEGRWTVHIGWSGTFFMIRDDDGEAVEAEAAAEIEIRR